jgi:hypothetical protein
MTNEIILLFEDDVTDRELFERELKRAFSGRKVSIEVFNGTAASPSPDDRVPYEIRLQKDIHRLIKHTGLVVCDQDLSGIDNYIGLSETVVSAVADEFGLPVALYARGKRPAGEQMLKRLRIRKPWTERKIILDLDGKAFHGLAHDCVGLYEGFSSISKALTDKNISGRQSLAATMAGILGEPELINTLALYSSGDQQYLQNVMLDIGDKKRALKQASTALGYWLWESILRFPGIILNGVAAASFLNIDPPTLCKDKGVSKIFESARYKGPFSGIMPFWWRHKLQALLDESHADDGLALVKKKHPSKRIRGCFCSVDPKERAGYYCMVTEKPVSEKHSRGKIAWFPAGADLARIELNTFKKYAPWIGLY